MIKWFMNLFFPNPVPFVISNESCYEYFLPNDETLELISFREDGYNLKPVNLPYLSRNERKKLKKRLTYIFREAWYMAKNDQIPEPFMKHSGCVRHSLLVQYVCHKHRLPCRLISCFVVKPKVGGQREFIRHCVAECGGWIMDISFGNDWACKSNVLYTGHFVNASSYGLVDGEVKWYRIKLDKAHWYFKPVFSIIADLDREHEEKYTELREFHNIDSLYNKKDGNFKRLV